jgi:ribonuclease P protein component
MLSKRNRVNKKETEIIFIQGKFLNSPCFAFKFIKSGLVAPKISFVVPKSISKLAVKRNLLRRKGYQAIKKHIASLPSGISGVFIYKKYEEDLSVLENEVKNILDQVR